MPRPLAPATYAQRIAFMCEIASCLHRYGTTSQRLETSILALSEQLGLECEPWSNPTGMILSFSDPFRELGTSDTTRVIRLPPGENDLGKLSASDRIADEVISGNMNIVEGHAALRALDQQPTLRYRLKVISAFGLTSGGIAGLWQLPWLDITTAALTGLFIGLISQLIEGRQQLREAADAIAALVAGLVAIAVSNWIAPLNLNTVIVASLVVLMPGLMLTNAFNELTNQHWISGVARFAGAVTTIVKLAVGSIIAITLAKILGVYPEVISSQPQPHWMLWCSMVVCAYGFALKFKTNWRDYGWVMGAAMSGYLIASYADMVWGSVIGIFLSAFIMTAAGNAFARYLNRPGVIIRLPGIIMLVPGGASMRSVLNLMDGGANNELTLMAVLQVLLSLMTGLLFGNLVVSSRKPL